MKILNITRSFNSDEHSTHMVVKVRTKWNGEQ